MADENINDLNTRIEGSKLEELGRQEKNPAMELAGRSALAENDTYLKDKGFGSESTTKPDNKSEIMAAFDKLTKRQFPPHIPIINTPPNPEPTPLPQPQAPAKAA